MRRFKAFLEGVEPSDVSIISNTGIVHLVHAPLMGHGTPAHLITLAVGWVGGEMNQDLTGALPSCLNERELPPGRTGRPGAACWGLASHLNDGAPCR